MTVEKHWWIILTLLFAVAVIYIILLLRRKSGSEIDVSDQTCPDEKNTEEKKLIEEKIDKTEIPLEEEPYPLDPDSVFAELEKAKITISDISNSFPCTSEKVIKSPMDKEKIYEVIRNHIKHTTRLSENKNIDGMFATGTYAARSIKSGKLVVINYSISDNRVRLDISGEDPDLVERIAKELEKLLNSQEQPGWD